MNEKDLTHITGFEQLLNQHKGKLQNALSAVYPTFPWDFSKGSVLKSKRLQLERIRKELDIKEDGDWYKASNIKLLSGRLNSVGLLILEKLLPLHSTLKEVYGKEFEIEEWKFHNIISENNHSYWEDSRLHRSILLDLGESLQFINWEDWYKINLDEESYPWMKNVLNFYGNSLPQLVTQVFAGEFNWKIWRFENLPKFFWKEVSNQRLLFNQYAEDLVRY